jgi:diguanylate cyclase (GGDEF)-like protein
LLNQGEIAHLPAQQRQSLGMATNLMVQALSEHAEESDLDDLLKKLEKPLYELLLRGEDPLNQADHPLRNLFNQIDRFAIVADDRGQFIDKDLGNLLGTVIDHAVEKADADPNSYTNANEALEKLLKHSSRAMKQRLAEHQELCEVQGIVREAKRKVARMLDSQLGGRSLPRVVLTLLDCGLRQYLILQTLRGQEDKCQDTLQLVQPLLHATESMQLGANLSAIEERLLQVNTDHDQINACMEELKGFQGRSGGKDNVTLAENWFSKDSELATQEGGDALSGDWPTRLGEWWDFEHEGRTIPMQLIWLDQAAGQFGFANRSVTRNVQLNRVKLAKRQATNTIRRGEDRNLPLLDRSANGAVDSLYRQLAHRAHHDATTKLLNRKGLMYAATRRPNRSGKGHVMGMLEFVPFRAIVDACGMDAGERLTQELIAIVQRRFGPSDALATVGDGRLAFMLADMDTSAAHNVVNTLAHAFAGFQFRHEQAQYSVEARIGLASLVPGNTDPTEALRRAATACVAAVNGGDTIQIYEDSGDQLREQESLREWGRRLDSLLSGDSLFLRCQQIAPLQENVNTRKYYEVLLGVRDEEGNVVSPQPFVEAVEYWKRSRDLDIWVIDKTFDWIRRNQDTFNRTGGFSINLSALSMSDPEILSLLHRQLETRDIDTSKIIFEITETATVGNYDEARDFIRQIRDYGCRFCIDDFGSGNASYGYLRNLKTDTLKIDGAFVKDMVGDPDLMAMVKSMNDIGHSLGMKTVAEFVANTDILNLVREIGVDYAQGYVIEKPVHIDELAKQQLILL